MIAQFLFLLQIVAPVFVVMTAGGFLRKISVLTAEADRSLTRLVVVLLALTIKVALVAQVLQMRLPILRSITVVVAVAVAD